MRVMPSSDGLTYMLGEKLQPSPPKPLTNAERWARIEGAIIELDVAMGSIAVGVHIESLRADVRRAGAGVIRDAVAAADADRGHKP